MAQFTITTNRETADQIKKHFEFEEKMGKTRSIVLGNTIHEVGFSIVEIKARDYKINPEDLFWLGYFSAITK